MKKIPYGTQHITEADIEAVSEVLRSDFLTQGPQVELFEQAISKYCGASYAIATSSATAALHISCLALGLKQGDYLWTTPNSFVASANCGLYCSAQVDFVDIEPTFYNLCPQALEIKLQQASKEGKLPKIVVVVHFAGQPCEMKEIHRLSKIYQFSIIEDASHAIGSNYQNQTTGSCRYSDLTVFSFHPVKLITTGEGGAITTNNPELAAKLVELRSHGITKDPQKMLAAPDGPWSYEQQSLGYNYRLTDIQAALGRSQLSRLDESIAKRHQIATYYHKHLNDLPIILPTSNELDRSALHLFPIQIDPNSTPTSRKDVYEEMHSKSISVNVHYKPIHLQPYYLAMGFKKGDYPVAENYYSNALSLPMYPTLTEAQLEHICTTLRGAFE